MSLSTCINCDSTLTLDNDGESALITEFLVSLSDCERSVSTFEALCSIFAINPTNSAYQDLPMCKRCALIVAELYRYFVELMELSKDSAYICVFSRQAQFWHRIHGELNNPDLNILSVLSLEMNEDEVKVDVKDRSLNIHPSSSQTRCQVTKCLPKKRRNRNKDLNEFSTTAKVKVEDIYVEKTEEALTTSGRIHNKFNFQEHLPDEFEQALKHDTCEPNILPFTETIILPKDEEKLMPNIRRSGRISESKSKKRIQILEAKKRRMKLHAKYNGKRQTRPSKSKMKMTNKTKRPIIRNRLNKIVRMASRKKLKEIHEPINFEENDENTMHAELEEMRPVKKVKFSERRIIPCENGGCLKTFYCNWMLDHHVRLDHLKIEPNSCTICGLKYFREEILPSHFCVPFHEQNEDRKLRPFVCKLCGRSMANRGNFTHHCSSHDTGDAERLRCDQCKLTFKRIENLKKHEKIHSMEKPSWQCAICGKVFYVKRRLKEHHEIHDAEKKYLCTVCGMRFAQQKALVRHHFIHQDNNRYLCPLCGKGFKRKDHLYQHYRSKVHPKALIETILSQESSRVHLPLGINKSEEALRRDTKVPAEEIMLYKFEPNETCPTNDMVLMPVVVQPQQVQKQELVNLLSL